VGSVKRFFLELHRRRVLATAFAYTAIGWLILQVGDLIVPMFELPEWGLRLVVISFAVGFPFIITFSWFFDITLSGIVRTEAKKRFELLDSWGKTILTFNDELIVGRVARAELEDGTSVDVGLVINDQMVSRMHAKLTPARRGVLIEDLGSSNGTFINDQRVKDPVLAGHEARLRFDVVEYSLLDHEPPAGVAGETVLNPHHEPVAGTVARPIGTITRPGENKSTDNSADG
jgi:hypothetical protein